LKKSKKDLKATLLEKNPERRLTNPLVMKRHFFFEGINWDSIYRKKVTPPFIPPVSSAMDISQIDPMFTEEKPSLDMSNMGCEDGEAPSSCTASSASTDAAMKTAFVSFEYVSPEHTAQHPAS